MYKFNKMVRWYSRLSWRWDKLSHYSCYSSRWNCCYTCTHPEKYWIILSYLYKVDDSKCFDFQNLWKNVPSSVVNQVIKKCCLSLYQTNLRISLTWFLDIVKQKALKLILLLKLVIKEVNSGFKSFVGFLIPYFNL